MSVRCLVCMHDLRRLASRWAAAFLAILRPLRVLLLHTKRAGADMYLYHRYGIVCSWGSWVSMAKIRYNLWLNMYWA